MDSDGIIKMVENKIEAAVEDYDMSDKMDGILVGFSGGADSSALLHYLIKKCARLGTKLCAAHVNHRIRGAEADADERFCREQCEALGVPLFVHRADVPAIAAETGRGVEETARGVRYEFFRSVVNENPGLAFIATAHNAEDNIETVIFNMLRGSGISGLSGIPPVRGYRIIRPLIYCTKSEIVGYCIAGGIPYVSDSTNSDTDYTRNYIRAEIIPKLSRINPSPEMAVSRLCSLLRTDDNYLHHLTHDFIDKYGIGTSAPRALLNAQPMPVLTRVISHMYTALVNTDTEPYRYRYLTLEFDHIHAAVKLISNGAPNARISLPGKICLYVDKKDAHFMTEEEYAELSAAGEPFAFGLEEGDNRADGVPYVFSLTMGRTFDENGGGDSNIYKKSIYAAVDFDKIYGKLFVRNRRAGDKFRMGGMTRSLKKLLCDREVPVFERDRLPLVCDDAGIVWIPGIGLRDGVAQTESTPETSAATVIMRRG